MLRTRSPLRFSCIATPKTPFDLHVLTTPPAFILSQDQTLRKRVQNLVIHELLVHFAKAKEPLFLSFDWGSQSIAQCIFQRSLPFKGKGFNQLRRQPHCQLFFSKIFVVFKRITLRWLQLSRNFTQAYWAQVPSLLGERFQWRQISERPSIHFSKIFLGFSPW